MDDFIVHGDTFEVAKDNLEKVLKRCIDTNLSLSHEKCHMLMNEGIVLGHLISSKGIQVDPKKVQIIQDLPTPSTQKDVRSFLGHAGYYRRFIENFSKIASPLFVLLGKDVVFTWTPACQNAFEIIKNKLVTTPVLRGPNWELPFHIHTDAFVSSMGVVLGQKEDNLFYSIYYISKNFTGAEVNYEKEFLAVVYVINKFQHYITGYKVFVHTDHSAIRFLMNKPVVTGQVIRWLLLLQEFDVTILDKPGRENVVADFLSRLH
jgi:hypothetical protein